LARDFGPTRFGSEGYAIEELVAELGAAFLCADLDLTLEPREDHAAYIANWLDVLKQTTARSSRQPATHSERRTSSTACSRRPPPANYRPWHPGLTVSVLLTFCRWSHTFMQNICRRVVLRQRLIYYKGRSTF
jgi:Zincin-like metallopeptidase